MNTNKIDILIIGQGLAGTHIAWQALKANATFKVIDHHHSSSSSKAAAGIINPITGRHFVKSWMIDELLPVAVQTYQELEQHLNQRFFYTKPIIRSLFSNKDENNWLNRSLRPGYDKYMGEQVELGEYNEMLAHPHGYGAVLNGGQLDTKTLLNSFKDFLISRDQYIDQQFDFDDLKLENGKAYYQDLEADKVIFCEGHQVTQNPYFNHLPFEPAKGEVLLIRFLNYRPTAIIKHKLFIVPLGEENLYWVGSNYIWNFEDDKPTDRGYEYLKQKLDEFIKVPYEIVSHTAGIRPSTKFRRPLMGIHPEHLQLTLFNGLGTKGSSLAPYWAKHFMDYLQGTTTLSEEVDFNIKTK